jgi:Fe-S-cluster containining protein
MQDLTQMIKHKDFDYAFDPKACEICLGKCCTGESGNIFLTKIEADAMATHLNLELPLFKEKYLVKSGYKASIKERVVEINEEQKEGTCVDKIVSHDCIFFSRETNQCTVYEVRPQQCRTFPFWNYFQNNFKELQEECIGVFKI